LQLHRQALQGAFPVAAAHDHAQVRGFAGPVQATVGEQVGAKAIDRTVFLQTAYVEARQIQLLGLTGNRQEGLVITATDHIHQWRFLTAQFIEFGEMRVAFGVGVAAGDRQTVTADDVDLRVGHRRTVADGLHIHVMAAVAGALGDDPEVCHHDKAQVAGAAAGVVECAFGRVILWAELEYENTASAAVGGQVMAEVDVVVDGFRRVVGRQRNIQRLTLDHAIEVLITEVRPCKAAAALVHQMLQLVGQQASDFHMGTGHATGHETQAFFAGEAEQGAVGEELQRARVGRHADQRRCGVFCQVAADGFQISGHAHIQRTTGRGLELECVQGVERFDAGHVGQVDLGAAGQQGIIDVVAVIGARVVLGFFR